MKRPVVSESACQGQGRLLHICEVGLRAVLHCTVLRVE